MHSAASSLSRMAANPRPIFECSMIQATATAPMASTLITTNRNET